MWTIYLLTLAPEVTLEDAGELITGSVYAGKLAAAGHEVALVARGQRLEQLTRDGLRHA